MRRPGGPRRLLALDLETTGFDASAAEVLAVGTVPVVDDVIRVGAATSTLVRPASRSAEEGIRAHHLRPSDVASAPTLAEVLPGVMTDLAAADALLVHHAAFDVPVLRRACAAMDVAWPRPAVIDTLDLVARHRRHQRATGSGRRLPRDLAGAREAVGLPPYPAHDALSDALATAELYLALCARHGG